VFIIKIFALLVLWLFLQLIIKSYKFFIMAHVISNDCTACGTCMSECPVNAISEGTPYKIDPEVCTDCGACADVCPVGAISQG